MQKFIEYISDLLFLHDCVIIPGFGGFICNYKSAYIDEDSGMICPPSKDILFNRNLIHNDGLLVSWIASKEHTSYEKATQQVTLFCEDLKIRLNQKQRVAFGDIGVFYTDRRFNIIFEQAKNNFFAEAYGMEPLETEKILPEEKVKNRQIDIPVSPVPEMSPYITLNQGNILHRLLKYGLAAAAVAGIIVITQQLDVFDFNNNGNINQTTLQPSLSMPERKSDIQYDRVISPSYDYIDYDPINDLYR